MATTKVGEAWSWETKDFSLDPQKNSALNSNIRMLTQAELCPIPQNDSALNSETRY